MGELLVEEWFRIKGRVAKMTIGVRLRHLPHSSKVMNWPLEVTHQVYETLYKCHVMVFVLQCTRAVLSQPWRLAQRSS